MKTDIESILFVCTGNLCRSPMAAGIIRTRYAGSFPGAVGSAGIQGVDGQPAHPLAQELMVEYGVDLSSHKARTLTPDLLMKSDLILTMEREHQEWIGTRMPIVRGKVYLLGYWRDLEITDPLAGGRPEFERAAGEIDLCLLDWVSQFEAREHPGGKRLVTSLRESGK